MRVETALVIATIDQFRSVNLVVGAYVDRLPEPSRNEIEEKVGELLDSIVLATHELRRLVLSVPDAAMDSIDVARMEARASRKTIAPVNLEA